MYAPSARAMKRGVPPTARKARTGELTPPGMTRRARSKSSALFISIQVSMHVARVLRHHRGFGFGRIVALRRLAFFFLRQGPEEAIGADVAHAWPETRVERMVEKGQRLADGGMQLDAGGEQGGEPGRQRLSGTDEGRLEALE